MSVSFIGNISATPQARSLPRPSRLRDKESAECRAVLERWEIEPLAPELERLLRLLNSRYMKIGYCHATHEKLAADCNVAKSTLQRNMDWLEALQYVDITRRPGSSNITVLSPGVADALRVKKLEALRAGALGYPLEISTLVCPPVENRPKALPKQTLPINVSNNGIITTSRESTKGEDAVLQCPEKDSHKHDEAATKLAELGVKKPIIKQLLGRYGIEHIERNLALPVPLHAKNPAGYIVAAIRADYARSTAGNEQKAQVMIKLLREGFDAPMALKTVQVWGQDLSRIERNIALQEHQNANNPGGYLMQAIREDYASRRAIPGSEHARVIQNESAHGLTRVQIRNDQKQRGNLQNTMPLTQEQTNSQYGAYRTAAKTFVTLPENRQLAFENQAKREIINTPPIHLRGLVENQCYDSPAFQAAVRTHAIILFLRNTGGEDAESSS